MVAPIIAAGLIAGGASLIGGAMSARAQRKHVAQERALQREFAQNSIRWRVDDAKAAGLHPLYAMGASGSTYSPTSFTDAMGPAVARAGSQFGSAVGQHYEDQVRAKLEGRNQARLDSGYAMQYRQLLNNERALNSQINVDQAQANYYNSMAAREMQASYASQDGLGTMQSSQADAAQNTGIVEVVPKELTTNEPGSPSIEAGQNPLWVKEKAGLGFTSVRLNDEAAEAYGDVVAPIINIAATTWHYMGFTLPAATKQNIEALKNWWITKGQYTRQGQEIYHRTQNAHKAKTDKRRAPGWQKAPRPRTSKLR